MEFIINCEFFLRALMNGDRELILWHGGLVSEKLKRLDDSSGEQISDFGNCIHTLRNCCITDSALAEALDAILGAIENESEYPQIAEKWEEFVVIILTGLKGYGIALMGNNIRCDGNRVTGLRTCPQRRYIRVKNRRMPAYPAIAGIWQFWDRPLWVDRNRETLYRERDKIFSGSASQWPIGRWFDYASYLVSDFLWKFSVGRASTLDIVGNRVESALIHGVYTTGDWRKIIERRLVETVAKGGEEFRESLAGSEMGIREPFVWKVNLKRDNVRFIHNFVKNAACHGIYHWGQGSRLQLLGDTLYRTGGVFRHETEGNGNGASSQSFRSLVTVQGFYSGGGEPGAESVVIRGLSGFASALAQGECAVYVKANTVSIVGNHVEARADTVAFRVESDKGLFTENLYAGEIDISQVPKLQSDFLNVQLL